MQRFPLFTSVFFAIVIAAAAGCGPRHEDPAATTSSPPLETHGVAPLPTSAPPSKVGALASRARPCQNAQVENTIHGKLYIGCSEGTIVVLDSWGRVLASTNVMMYGITSITAAGDNAIAVQGYNDGADLRHELTILRATTLRPIVTHSLTDTTLLGVVGDRAFIDDWCCHGRPDVYQPATIYAISLKDGSESRRVDLTPDHQAHDGNHEPLGQGSWNYLIGNDFYVVVGEITYRYDVRHLQLPPVRMATSQKQ